MFDNFFWNKLVPMVALLLAGSSAYAQTVAGNLSGSLSVTNGAAQFSLPIQVVPGRGGMQPELGINYSSNGGAGHLGLGWSLSGLSAIYRCSPTLDQDGFSRGISFDGNDRYCLDGQRLVPVDGTNGGVGTEYRTEIDSYSQILSVGGTSNHPDHFVVKTKAGQVMTFGGGSASHGVSQGTLNWSLSQINDTTGNNPITYSYITKNNTQYLSNISYAGGRVDVIYSSLSNYISGFSPITGYFKGTDTQSNDVISSIKVSSDSTLIRTYNLDYSGDTTSRYVELEKITACDAAGNCMTPLNFSWSGNQSISFSTLTGVNTYVNGKIEAAPVDIFRIRYGDFNGDGRSDVYVVEGWDSSSVDKIYLSNGNGTYNVINGINSSVPDTIEGAHIDLARIKYGDFNGDGKTDIYYVNGWGGASRDKIYLSHGDGSYTTVNGLNTYVKDSMEGAPVDISRINMGDFNGDGRTDIYYINGWGGSSRDDVFLSNGDGTFSRVDGLNTSINDILEGARIDIARLKFIDFNGDGKTDIYLVNGWGGNALDKVHLSNGDGSYQVINGINSSVADSLDGGAGVDIARVNFGDFNGDGNLDVYHVNGYGESAVDTIYFSKGDGNYQVVNGIGSFVNDEHAGAQIDISRLKFIDFNGDGKTDIYQIRGWDNASIDKIHLSKGDGTFSVTDGLNTSINGSSFETGQIDISRIQFGEFTGDGAIDIYYINGWGGTFKDTIYSNSVSPRKLASVVDAYGNESNLTYRPLTDESIYTKGSGASYPVVDVQGASQVVSKLETSNGVGGTNTVNYHYAGYKANLRGRGSYGYAQITESYPETGKSKVTTFDQSGFPRTGNVISVTELYNGSLLNKATNSYSLGKYLGGVYSVNLAQAVQQSYELDGSLVSTVTTEHSNSDEYGNIGTIKVTTSGGGETFTKTTTSHYYNDTSNWFLGRLSDSLVTHSGPSGTQTRKSAFSYNSKGLLATEQVVSTDTGLPLTTTKNTYDDYGQKTQVVVSADGEQDRVTTSAYDSLGKATQTCNVYNLCETYTYTPERWLKSTTGPNGLTTSWTYDGFGRKVREDRPDGTATTISRYFASNSNCGDSADYATTCVLTQSTGAPSVRVQQDSLGREVRKITQGFDGKLVYSDTVYNPFGLVEKVSRNYYAGDHIYWATSEYDALDRIIRATEPGPHGSVRQVTTQYNGLTSTTVSGNEYRSKTVKANALGQQVYIEEEEGSFIRYTYDGVGNLLTTTVSDDPSTTIALQYDEFGRKIAMDDPDMGHWEYSYNAFGQLTSQTDAKNQTVSMEYDLLGRMVKRTEPEGISTWVYGDATAPQGSIGKLLSETGNGLTKLYTYDSLGRAYNTTTEVDGHGSFTAGTRYDALGRIAKTIYPGSNGFYTENIYDSNGYLESVRGLRVDAEEHDLSRLQPLIQEAVTLAEDYLSKANQLKEIGQYYQSRIDNYAELLAKQTIQFEQGTTDGLEQNVPYDFLSAGDGVTFYIRVHDKVIPIASDVFIPIVVPAEYHYRVTYSGNTQTISQISVSEFESVEPSLIDSEDQIYVLNSNTITCACESVEHVEYLSNLQSHQSLLAETVSNGESLSPEFLNHLNNTMAELETVQSLINRQAESYSSTAAQLTVLAEQTLAAADHSFRVSSTLNNVADAYSDMVADNEFITYWRAVDVDASGRIRAEVYGNGIVNDYTYNQGTGQLQAIHSSMLSIVEVMRHLEYQYDDYQNVALREDLANDIREIFTYDRIDRLTSTQVSSGRYTTDDLNQTQTLSYDSLGNITYKSDVGDYSYGNNAGPHAVTTAGANTYVYDANGNMTSGNGRTIQWSSFNKPVLMTQEGRSAAFSYGPGRARYKKVNHKGDTTLYVGGLYELLSKGSATEEKHYIYAGGQLVAEHIVSSSNGVQTRYLHKDALGSIDLVTDAFANVVDRRSFDAWGKLREFPWKAGATLDDPLYLTQLPYTNKGFTGHESIQEVDLIHMNGRVYDATLARFLSADTFIQAASSSQSYNRYSYVLNNPLKYSDPSGHFFKKLLKKALKILPNPTVYMWTHPKETASGAGIVAVMVICPECAPFVQGLLMGAINAAIVGGNIAKGAVIGGLSGGVFGAIGQSSLGFEARVLAHGLAGGVISVMQGGKFGQGFVSSAFTKFVTLNLAEGAETGSLYDMQDKDFGKIVGRTAIAALVGGTTSVIGGGKFANGAQTAAMAHLFNGEGRMGRHRAPKSFRGATEQEILDALRSEGLWNGKDDIAFFGVRPLGGPDGVFLRVGDNVNINVMHEHAFGVENGRLVNIGYTGDTLGVNADPVLSQGDYSSYIFSRDIYQGNMRTVANTVLQSGGWAPNDYNILTHNCQDFADAMKGSF
ncbi:hypothetical protein BTA51_16640 [Hahella sp. CCB-MM4]|uniref:FG-GAP-like repeat-containing protein n=1 Tax=Hahella sp. (strain CCB-MM4) TaxID=1926491 RepID=UPI000B9C562D|nr:FG-GAP-like repeat-containing protein [Hahella sp. CCB-MM4]OZG72357.1 hypothetical protein BTA51_16640 [Hahella sp. CCB-MM4]